MLEEKEEQGKEIENWKTKYNELSTKYAEHVNISLQEKNQLTSKLNEVISDMFYKTN